VYIQYTSDPASLPGIHQWHLSVQTNQPGRTLVIQAPKGTFDILPEDAARRDELARRATAILGAAGYRRIETPTFEATELFARGVGEATDIVQKEMYSFDDGAGRSLTLRPEGTAPVCRAYIEHGMHKLAQPVKLWYLSSFFRAEAPQRGRYRQFWQVGAEAIGSDAPETDAELIVLLADLLDALGVRHDRLRLSSLGTPATRAEYRERLQGYLRAHQSELAEEVRSRIELNPMRAFDSSDRRTQAVMREAPKLLDHLTEADADHFGQTRALLDAAGLTYELDPTLVRGMDYYTRTVFEFTSDALGAQSGLGGGGRYDGLIELLDGPSTPACGWAAGVERMLLAARDLRAGTELVDLFVALAKRDGTRAAFELAREARRAGLQAQLELAGRSLKGQLKHADRIHARWVAIVGANGGATLKDMESGEQRDTELRDVIPTILRGHRPL
jgi:histidyl-tRNA synthetase